jgi:SAM-dependent methyltransferase
MNQSAGLGTRRAAGQAPRRTVLHVGCGPAAAGRLHAWFTSEAWSELRVDVDPAVRPDMVASITDLSVIGDAEVDAIWASHVLEHLADHDVPVALREMTRVLRPDGFALVTSPDIVTAARAIVAGRLEDTMYVSPAGPVAALDVLYGFRPALRCGRGYMAHRTAFTEGRLGRLMVEAGFAEVRVATHGSDLWALALMPDAVDA